jgi:hypothetical protein
MVAVKPVGKRITEQIEEDIESGKAKPYAMFKNNKGLEHFLHFLAGTSMGASCIKNQALKAYFEHIRNNRTTTSSTSEEERGKMGGKGGAFQWNSLPLK